MNRRKRFGSLRPLLLWIVAVLAVWALLQFHSSTIDGRPKLRDPVDIGLLALLALGSTALVIVTMAGTRDWTVRGVGLLSIFLGDGLLWWSALIVRLHRTPTPEPVVDLLRAVFLTGLPLVLIGIAGYVGDSRPIPRSVREKFQERSDNQDLRGDRQDRREDRQDMREGKLDSREGLADTRQEVADTREELANIRQELANIRQEAQDDHDAEGETP